MKITKVGKEVKPGFFKATYKSAPIEGDTVKMKARFEIERSITEDTEDVYDIYDMFADLANAFNELKSGVEDGPAMAKWDERQAKIKEILG